MPVILNCLDEPNTCVVGGNHFQFKPGQLKYFHDINIASLISRIKASDGFIALPDELEHLSHLKEEMMAKVITPEEKAIIEEKRKEGINNYCQRLRELIYNATVSLQKDIDVRGYKYDARVEATKADLKRLETLAKYQSEHLDLEQKRVDTFKELEKKVAKTSK